MNNRFGLVIASGAIDNYARHRAMLARLPAPDAVICADGGLRHVRPLGVAPDLITGDFDSVCGALLDEYRDGGVPIERLPVEKDFTDTETAVERAVGRGCGAVLILGALGSRADHVYANLQLLFKYALRGVRVALADANNAAAVLTPGRAMKIDKLRPIASLLGLPPPAEPLDAPERLITAEPPVTPALPPDFPEPTLRDQSPQDAAVLSGVTPSAGPKLSIFPVGGEARGVSAGGVKYRLCGASLEACYTSGVSNEFISREATVEVAEGAVFVMVCDD